MIIDQVLNSHKELSNWKSYEKINSGFINDVYIIKLKDKKLLVLRLLKNAGYLFIDRLSEMKNSLNAEKVGVGPKNIVFDLNKNLTISEYIEGKVINNEDVKDKKIIGKVIKSMKKLHNHANFDNIFDPFALLDLYKISCKYSNYKKLENMFSNKVNLFKIYLIKLFLNKNMGHMVSCHNDIRAFGNIIEINKKILFVDYEFSGKNDACYDIGFFWSESSLSLNDLEFIVKEYFDNNNVNNNMIKSYLYAMVADYLWYLQAIVGLNSLDNKEDWKRYSEITYKNFCRRSSFINIYKLIFKKSIDGIVV